MSTYASVQNSPLTVRSISGRSLAPTTLTRTDEGMLDRAQDTRISQSTQQHRRLPRLLSARGKARCNKVGARFHLRTANPIYEGLLGFICNELAATGAHHLSDEAHGRESTIFWSCTSVPRPYIGGIGGPGLSQKNIACALSAQCCAW